MNNFKNSTIDKKEIANFYKMSQDWWNPTGKFYILHQINNLRLSYIKENICSMFNISSLGKNPLKNIKILDVGCGGGLLCEPLAKLGATMYGIDPLLENIESAKIHSKNENLNIKYIVGSIEKLKNFKKKFDVIISMEVIEHILNIDLFLSSINFLIKYDGILFLSTINRTLKAWIFAIIVAEYILKWLPIGTHSYNKFIKPEELKKILSKYSIKIFDEVGIKYNIFNKKWNFSLDKSINYMITARNIKIFN